MLAKAILDRIKSNNQPNHNAALIMSNYISKNCNGSTLKKLLELNNIDFSKSPEEIIYYLITNQWNALVQNQELIISLERIVKERYNFTNIIIGPTGKNFKLSLFSTIITIFATWLIYLHNNKTSINYIPFIIYAGAAIATSFIYGIFTNQHFLSILLGILMPILVPTLNFVFECLVVYFHSFGGFVLTLLGAVFLNVIIHLNKFIILKLNI